MGGRTGHLAVMLDETRFRAAIGKPTAKANEIVEPLLVPTGLTNAPALARTRLASQNKIEWHDCAAMIAVKDLTANFTSEEKIDKTHAEELEQDRVDCRSMDLK